MVCPTKSSSFVIDRCENLTFGCCNQFKLFACFELKIACNPCLTIVSNDFIVLYHLRKLPKSGAMLIHASNMLVFHKISPFFFIFLACNWTKEYKIHAGSYHALILWYFLAINMSRGGGCFKHLVPAIISFSVDSCRMLSP